MKINAETYRQAASERLAEARLLMAQGRFAPALYFSGVAVECIVRAYLTRRGAKFDSRHNLRILSEAAKFDLCFPRKRIEVYDAHLTTVHLRWHNIFRYATEARVRAFLKKSGLDRGQRGNFLKSNCGTAFGAATALVEIGQLKWTHSRDDSGEP